MDELGDELLGLRVTRGLPRVDVARVALLSSCHLCRLERGVRRTRRSTLERIVAAVAALSDPDDELDVDAVVEHLVTIAGPALADESPWKDRILRRAERRARRHMEQDPPREAA